MPLMGGAPQSTQPSPDFPQALSGGGLSGPPNAGPLGAVEGIIGSLSQAENDLNMVAEQYPPAAEFLRQAVQFIRQASVIIIGTAQTGARSPFVPIRG
jgi:hypothetical protein